MPDHDEGGGEGPDPLVGLLRCPHCRADLELTDGTAGCANRHSFDLARQGYLNLLPGNARPGTGDTAAMVQARAAFLGAGHYRTILDAIAGAATTALAERDPGTGSGCVIELGAGTAHHLAGVLDVLPNRVGLALDISKHAARRATHARQRIGAVVCDAWAPLPVRTAVAAVALSVFAPRNGAEIARVLLPGGALVVVTPTAGHLAELVPVLGLLSVDERKQERLDSQLDPYLAAESTRSMDQVLLLRPPDVEHLVAMGPSARHTDPGTMHERIAALADPIRVTASVTVAVYRRP